ncbi:MAG TPA: hypothetical protein DEP72_06555 [Clostridiales bacterium]|nr:MAG: hypothetical protein A2Y18_03550 [Clostridiales bacterium GWD2_32_19]HCC07799.1 hypothetical protein [Clostridiales bacterium]
MNIDLSTYTEELLPANVKLTGYATNANILINIKGRGLLLIYNKTYDMLYPFYATTINRYEFKSDTVSGIQLEFKEHIKRLGLTEEYKKQKVVNEVNSHYELENCEITEKLCSEQWIKYSKTGNEWRFYSMDFYCAEKIESVHKILGSSKDKQVFLPLDDNSIRELINTGRVDGIKVVENFLKMLGNEVFVNEIKKFEV